VKPHIPPWTILRMPPWAHSSTLTHCAYMFWLSGRSPKGEGYCDTAVRTVGHFARFTPDSAFFHHTFCTVHTVHIVCSPFTLVVNPLLTTIVHHFFSSVLAEPQTPNKTLSFFAAFSIILLLMRTLVYVIFAHFWGCNISQITDNLIRFPNAVHFRNP
jgi:hypothetical protein